MARLDKRRLASALAKYAINPVVKGMIAVGLPPPGVTLLETTGRRSGEPRRTPVGARRDGDTLWLVAEHGRRAGYVRNIEAYPRVRVKIGRRWLAGRGAVVPDDDWRARLREIGRASAGLRFNSGVVRAMKSEPVTVRIDLD